MPKPSDDFETAVAALARLRGVSPDEIKAEMLTRQMVGSGPAAPAGTQERPPPADQPVRRRESLARAETTDAVDRYAGESAEEAKERWYEEEADLPDGVLGLGGSEAGGIFGAGPIATANYDPAALARGEGRVTAAQQVRVFQRLEGVLNRVERSLGTGAARAALEGAVPTRRRLR